MFSQNRLFFASVILTKRPFWSVPAYYQDCIRAAHSIERLILLLESTFGLEDSTYLMGYCVYTGAPAILEDAKNGNYTSQKALSTLLTRRRREPLSAAGAQPQQHRQRHEHPFYYHICFPAATATAAASTAALHLRYR